jgi:tetrahydromethanopterin S-methyltransferase subunit G
MELEEFVDEVRGALRDFGTKVDAASSEVSRLAGSVEGCQRAHQGTDRAAHHRMDGIDEDVDAVRGDLTEARVELAGAIASGSKKPAVAAGSAAAAVLYAMGEALRRFFLGE